ncbi:MAG: TetR/AcrR family transcriptional regulator [Myxococcota bacterium]
MAQVKNKKTQQSEATRAELLKLGAELLAERGYAGTSLGEIAQRAGLTKGAIYHHFRGKEEIFAAVVEEVLLQSLYRIQEASREQAQEAGETRENSWERLFAMVELLLDSFREPAVRQIVWLDGPAALGWERWHAIVAEHTLLRIEIIMELIAKTGVLPAEHAQCLAQLMFGALQEAGLTISHAEDPKAARAGFAATLRWMVRELFLRDRASSPST